MGGFFAFYEIIRLWYCWIMDKPPSDPAEHAREFARTWADKLEEHCSIRMQELGIPDDMNGQPDYGRDGNGEHSIGGTAREAAIPRGA